MKTIFKNGEYDRVDDKTADLSVKSGWKFVPKSEWKKNVRDFERDQRIARAQEKAQEKIEKNDKK